MVRVSIDIVFYKSELLRMSVSVLRTIELDALQIFKAVVDFGGVTRAAAQLHRVPSNVTTRLKQLEEELGTKLFHRQAKTPAFERGEPIAGLCRTASPQR
jgi:hypothetical protein